MDYFKKDVSVVERDTFLKKLAIFSIGIYVIFSTMFDTVAGLGKLSSLSIYFCLGCCAIYILERGTFKLNFIVFALITVGILFSISVLYTPASKNLVNTYLYRYWTSAILVSLISNTVTKREDIIRVVDYYIAAGVFLALLIYNTYGFSNLASAIERIDAQLGNQNIVGISCAFSVILAIYMLATKKGKIKIWYSLAAVISFPAVMFTGSRKSLLIIFVAVLAFVFSYSKNKRLLTRLFWVIVIVIGLYLLIFYVPAFEMIKGRILSTLDAFQGSSDAETLRSDTNRMRYMAQGFAEFLKKPIWGNGFCYSYYFFGKYSHNNYIEMLMNGGLLTFVAYYSMYFAVYKKALTIFKTEEDRKYSAFIIMILVALITMDFGVVSYYKRYTLILLAICYCNALPVIDKTERQDGEKNEFTSK